MKLLTPESTFISADCDVDIILSNFEESPIQVTDYLKDKWKAAQYGLIIFENQLHH